MNRPGTDFTKYVKDKNLLTPNFIEYGRAGRFVYEITSGRGFNEEHIYGVTVVETGVGHLHDLSKCFYSLKAARDYASSLVSHTDQLAVLKAAS